jgi:hypothetical protein
MRRSQMRVRARNQAQNEATRAPVAPVELPTRGSRVRAVVSNRQPDVAHTIPVTPAQMPGGRTHLRTSEARDPVLEAIAEGFSGLRASMDRLTTAIRQANGLDEADQELDDLRATNAALQAEVAHLQADMAALTGPVAEVAQLAVPPSEDPDPGIEPDQEPA